MCFDVQATFEAQIKRAQTASKLSEAEKSILETEVQLPAFHLSGFSHPKMLIYTSHQPYTPLVAQWGLIPRWVKSEQQAESIQNKTLNARIETIHEKPSFRQLTSNNRCVIPVNGFFEYHYENSKAHPYFIYSDRIEFYLGGLWDEWVNTASGEIIFTFSILTTKANELMSKIHNNPKLKESRMPFMIESNNIDDWLNKELNSKNISRFPLVKSNQLKAHQVMPLKGKLSLGNVPQVNAPIHLFD